MTEPAPIGHNEPPSPFMAIADKINELFAEAKQWLDGEPISSQGQADDLSNLKNMIRDAGKEAEALRAEEVKPFDDGRKEVWARYDPLIADKKSAKGLVALATAAIKEAQRPWEIKLAEEQAERERVAHEEAEAARRKAEEAARAAQAEADSLAAREKREAAIAAAEEAEKAAKRVVRDAPKTGGGIGRATHLRSEFHPVLQNGMQALAHYLAAHPAEVEQFLLGLASEDVRNGAREIPGFEIIEEKKVV